jgi:hypothetical protein
MGSLMATGDHQHHHEKPEDFAAHSALLHQLLDDPKFAAAVKAYRNEDDSRDIPFLGGSDNAGSTVYFDRRFVAAIKAGKVLYKGKPFDPRPFLKVHESIEGALIRGERTPGRVYVIKIHAGPLGYSEAHAIATWAERRAVEHASLDWQTYQDALKPFIRTDETEKVANPPPDLLKVPYEGTPQLREVEAKDAPMANLTAGKRAGMPNSQFALPGKRFPLNDATHQRLAIGGATRAQHTGNISASTAERIKAEARAKLGIKQSPGGYVPNQQRAVTAPGAVNPAQQQRLHALSIASATHLHNQGHLPAPQKNAIHAKARASLNLLKRAPQQPPMAFGSLSPMLNGPAPAQGAIQGPMQP